ncbi:DUF922 domain-containing protein [Hymenobacter profundi]|uniref:DUF922 domain-containing Zn-dependent protease n=1 Tax=Hymenobacter profundi TaxID=1982110 RepID=A0ABS6X7I4_9BACT|nr:DUF922 domain-containing protein [Hymenobacter profundi]MBW3130919.1 DUF922 domain-containing Zn-dependent protease [Hymenobacter profundi]
MSFFSFLLPSLLLGGFFSVPTPAQTTPPKPEVIAWSAQRKLTWADFKTKPTPADRLAALTSANIDVQVGCKDFVFSSQVQAVFMPTESWVREATKASPELLRHEQLHFDITELYARRMRQKLSQTQFDCQHLQPKFQNLTKAMFSEWQREEARYDQATNHGLNKPQQQLWETQVQQKLAQLEQFALAQ